MRGDDYISAVKYDDTYSRFEFPEHVKCDGMVEHMRSKGYEVRVMPPKDGMYYVEVLKK